MSATAAFANLRCLGELKLEDYVYRHEYHDLSKYRGCYAQGYLQAFGAGETWGF